MSVELGRHSYGDLWEDNQGGGPGENTVGNFTSIGGQVRVVYPMGHNTGWVSTFPFTAVEKPEWGAQPVSGHPTRLPSFVAIGSDVCIGRDAIIFGGVEIGHGAVVGAFAVVKKSVRPYAVVVGNPAREIRRRFDDETVERLLAVAWWDWPDSKIKSYVPLLCSPDARAFLEAAEAEQQA